MENTLSELDSSYVALNDTDIITNDALGLDGARLGDQDISTSLAIELDTDIFRFRRSIDGQSSYLYVSGAEAENIRANFADTFTEAGLAFKVSAEPQDDLIDLYRFRSNRGTYLLVGEDERNSINSDPNLSSLFTEEGRAFSVYGAGAGKAQEFSRFRDLNIPSNYLYATGTEAETIRTEFASTFVDEGVAFEANLLSINNPPQAPQIINPLAGSIINPASLKFQLPEDFTLDDPDGDQHEHTDYEIWLEGENQPAWVAYDITDDFFKIHAIVPTIGTFVNSHSGRDSFLPDQNYILRVRVADEWGAESPWTEQINRTASVTATSPQENIPWKVLEEGYGIDVVAEGLRLPVQLDFNTTNGLIVGSELHDGPFTVDSTGNVYRLAKLIDYDPGNDIGGQSERGAIGIAYHEESHSLFQGLLDANAHPVIYRLFLSDDGLSTVSMEKIWEYPDEGKQAHQIGNLAIHDGYLYVNMGDKFDAQTAEDLDSPWGKILRMSLDGSAVANNPFYDVSDGINAKDYIYSYGFRNPIGGDWFDGEYYVVENGPNRNDRLVVTLPGKSYGWNGKTNSLLPDALYVWGVTESPVDIAFDDGGNGYISLSGPTYGSGRSKGKTIDKVTITEDGSTLDSKPTDFIRYTGDGKETASGLLYISEGFGFSEGLY